MSISTYAELQTSIASWLNRSDLTATIPDFIALAEAEMNSRLVEDPVRPMSASAAGTISAETLATPTNMIRPKTLEISDGTSVWRVPFFDEDSLSDLQPLQYDANAEIIYGIPSPGPIRGYTIVGDDFRFFPVPTASYTYVLKYWRTIPALSDSNTTNWLLTRFPNAYLYGALAQAGGYTVDDSVAAWSDAFEAAMARVLISYPTPTDAAPLRNDLPFLDTGRLW